EIAGKHATFDIVARSEEGKEAQFSVDCYFGELGDCGRKRFPATYEKRDFLFELQMPAKPPGSEGTIAITSDVDNTGKAVDVFEIRVSVSNGNPSNEPVKNVPTPLPLPEESQQPFETAILVPARPNSVLGTEVDQPTDRYRKIVDFIRGYGGGDCFIALPA